jgi:hypothetical protein
MQAKKGIKVGFSFFCFWLKKSEAKKKLMGIFEVNVQ